MIGRGPNGGGGKPLSKSGLARLLSPFGIQSGTIRDNGRFPKGYYLSAFNDAFARYIPPENATTPQPLCHSDCGAFQNATTVEPVALSKPPQACGRSDCGGVASSEPLDGTSACEIEL
jgi:hypothetical protein